MKKSIIRFILLSIILIIISLTIILMNGKTYTYTFNNCKNYEIENSTGKIKVIEEKKINNKTIIKIKSVKPGKVDIIVNYNNDQQEIKIVYVHKSMILTDNSYFGDSNAIEVIPISISIILLYILYLLIKRYRYHKKQNLYQYKNIAYLGIIIFLLPFTINNIFSIFNYNGALETINKTIESVAMISFILLPIALITFILVTISNIVLVIKEGKSLRNLLGVFLGIFLCIMTILPDRLYEIILRTQIINIHNLNSIGPYLYNYLETLIYLLIAYLECILLGTIIIAIKAVHKKVKYDKDYMIILGCKIKKDGTLPPLLRGRVDKAIEFRNKQLEETNKDLIFIPSGGKGKDEVISESEAIKNYLLSKGIKEKNILVEDKSTNTYQNIKYSNKLINNKNKNIAFSTTNYHVLRAGLIATEQGIKLEGIGSRTKAYFWINAFIREFIGTLFSEKKKHIIVFLIIMIFIATMIGITYFANNI